jgi:hypothetical protein
MSKKLTKAQLQPIMNILDFKKEDEIRNIKTESMIDNLKKIEQENIRLVNPLSKKIEAINKQINDYNKEIKKFVKSVGEETNTFNSLLISLNQVSATPLRANSYNINGFYTSLKVSNEQYAKAGILIEQKRRDIDMKYEVIKAKIILSEDFASIENILALNGISLGQDVKEKL